MLDQAQVDDLRSHLRGEVIARGEAGYDAARRVYNAMIDRYPAVVARCADVADVREAVRFGREHDLLVAVRGGGHNGGGLGTCDGGIVIDLSRMRGVRVDPEARTVRVDGGCTWGDVDHATHAFGMAAPAGIISTTGVAGLTLGGGIGHLTRRCGLTIDNLLEADVVLADGRIVTASAARNDDLYWAIRGGGGNFGVVTSFLFRLHEVAIVTAGPMVWPMEQAAEVMQFYREFIVKAPEELNGFLALMTVPPAPPFPAELHMKKMCAIVWCHSGPAAKVEDALRPVRAFSRPAFEFLGQMPYPRVQSMFDGLYPPGLQWYWKADFVTTLGDKAIAAHVEHGANLPTMHSTMHLYPIDGAAHRVSRTATPFAYRDANWAEVIVGVDPSPANRDRIVSWARAYWDATHPFGAGGAYVNFMMEEDQDRVRASYGENYDRLVRIKAKYDPANFFRVNQNIRPAAAHAAGA
ncbi:MAG TPA: FAD-binding oxidoreductase [Vicinamibacterales bacterium]|jgi:FAD/FMN-containing dehydrogenase